MPEPAASQLAALDGDPRRVYELLGQIPALLGVFRGRDHVVEFANPAYRRLTGDVPMVGRPVAELYDQPENRGFIELLDRVYETGERFDGRGVRGVVDGVEMFVDFTYLPLRSAGGSVEGVMVHAVDVTGQVVARQAAEESERRLRTLWEADVVGVCVAGESTVLEANDAFLAIAGRDRAALEAGRVGWRDLTPPEWAPADDRAWEDLRVHGRAEPYEKEVARPDGSRIPVLAGAVCLEREPLRAMGIFVDLSARRAAEREREVLLVREREARREAELAAGRISRLQRITAALSAAISADDVAQLVVEAAVESLGAAAGVVALRDGDELAIRRQVGYEDRLVADWQRFSIDTDVPLADAVRSREPVLLGDQEAWDRRYGDTARRSARGYQALAAVPFLFHGDALGAMGLSFSQDRTFSATERAFLMALGRQCGQALERARLYEERAYVARTLQEGLLPERLSPVPGLEVAVRYRSISDGGRVGGDFYDLFDVAEERWLLAIGDVCGKGTAAAVLTGLARHTIRAIAMREPAPEAVLGFLNEAMRRQVADGAYCTVGCAGLTRSPGGGISVRLASGGHPYPLLLRPGEPIREVPVPGTLLGFVEDLALEGVALELAPGDTLVFYTDGVTDARGDGDRFGDEGLLAALEAGRGGDAEALAGVVEDAVGRHQPGLPRDDWALMVLRVAD